MSATSSDLDSLFSDFSTCDVSDGLLKLGVKSGGFLPDISLRTTMAPVARCVGRVWPVQFVEKSSPRKAEYTGHYIDHVPAGKVVLLSCPTHLTNACFGGIMAMRASVCGARGVVVDGRIRDVPEMDDLQKQRAMPVFSRGTSIVGAGGGCKPVAINVAVEVNGYGTVRPDDIVMADEHGVVVVGSDIDLEKLVAAIMKGVEADEKVKADVMRGMTVADVFAKWR